MSWGTQQLKRTNCWDMQQCGRTSNALCKWRKPDSRGTCCLVPFICYFGKGNTNRDRKQIGPGQGLGGGGEMGVGRWLNRAREFFEVMKVFYFSIMVVTQPNVSAEMDWILLYVNYYTSRNITKKPNRIKQNTRNDTAEHSYSSLVQVLAMAASPLSSRAEQRQQGLPSS